MRLMPSTGLAVLLGSVASAHVLKPDWFDAIVPRALPGPVRAYTVGSAVVEFALAAALTRESTRRAAGYAAASYFAAVFPANVQMALDGGMPGHTGPWDATLAWVRLPFQIPLVWWAVQIGRDPRA